MPTKRFWWQWLGKKISRLILCGDRQNGEHLADKRAKEMITLVNVFRPGAKLGIVGDLQRATVVLEYLAMDLGMGGVHLVSAIRHFLK